MWMNFMKSIISEQHIYSLTISERRHWNAYWSIWCVANMFFYQQHQPRLMREMVDPPKFTFMPGVRKDAQRIHQDNFVQEYGWWYRKFLWDHIAIVFAVRHAFKIGILSHHNEILTEDLYNPFDVSNVRKPVNFKFMQASEFLNQKVEGLCASRQNLWIRKQKTFGGMFANRLLMSDRDTLM